jgi:hypothetical protein
VYVTGSSIGSGTSLDYATIKYNSTGVQQWVQRYNGPGNFYDEAYAIAVDGSGNVYVTGCSASQNSSPYNFDYATIKYVQTGAIEENHSPLSAQNYTLELFPNPAKTYFNIRFSQSADRSQIKIFDISGKEIRCLRLDVASAPSTLRVTLDGIKNGVYFVQVGNEMVKEKLVVTKKYE